MDYSDALGVIYREVKDATRDGQPARVVRGIRTYATGLDDLWDALTNIERIPRWFATITGDLKLGGRYQLKENAEGEITRCEPPEALEITWEYGGNVSWVTLRLEADGDGARLTLEHIMLKDEAGETHWEQYGPGATGVGWDLSFFGLALHVKSGGDAIDREATDAWLASDAGKSFIRDCAAAWGEAHIAAGEATEAARAMAERTAKFYTGG